MLSTAGKGGVVGPARCCRGNERSTLAVGVGRVEIEGKLVVRSLQDQEQHVQLGAPGDLKPAKRYKWPPSDLNSVQETRVDVLT